MHSQAEVSSLHHGGCGDDEHFSDHISVHEVVKSSINTLKCLLGLETKLELIVLVMIICSKKNKLRLFITDFFREGQDSFHHECEARVVKTAVLTRAKKSVMKSAYFLFEHVIFF